MSVSMQQPSTLQRDPLALFFESMQHREQDIRDAALAVEYCNVFDCSAVSDGQYTAAIQALGSLMTTIHTFQMSFFDPSVPLLAFDARGAAQQGAWIVVLELIDKTIVALANCSLPACLGDACEQAGEDHSLLHHQHTEVLEAVADALSTNVQWRDSVRYESLRFVRLRDAARFRQRVIRRRRWK
jgi:hypothetical protein